MAPPTFQDTDSGFKPLYSDIASSQSSPGTIFISGQYGSTKTGSIPPSYEAQVHLALLNLRKCLLKANLTVKDILKLTVYIVDYTKTKRAHAPHLLTFLNGHRPAMTLVPVPELAKPEILFEIEAVASLPEPKGPVPTFSPELSQPILDVIVVGAGLSGLQAARTINKAGLSCIVLEARDRVGGKTWTKEMRKKKGHGVELGAAWINDTNQTTMWGLAKEFGLETVEQNTQGDCVLIDFEGERSTFPYGSLPEFSAAEKANAAEIRDKVESDCQEVDVFNPTSTKLDTMTFQDYVVSLGAGKAALANAATWTRAMLGVEPTELSALFFLNYCKSGGGLLQMRSDRKGGGQHLRLRKGTQGFSKALASVLPEGSVKLSTPVLAITELPGQNVTEVTTTYKTYLARKVIVSVPTPVYKTISFTPALPPAKTLLSESTKYGYYTKAIIAFKSSFWKSHNLCGLSQSFVGPASVIRDTSTEIDSSYTLTCFVAGIPGREWSLLPAEEKIDVLLKQVAKVYTPSNDLAFVREQFEDWIASEWLEDPYAGWGCPCASTAPGVLDATGSEPLREVVGNVHFVGTETAGEWKGYMEGAVRSGERGAIEVLNILKPAKAKM
ncbi:amine oxidase-10 [Coleophoma crateriformis]|uniref:Amine oxidase n=1 Tax=Coleophoma crateriformis TaxID=565419 RepID=A0A3D8RDY6_9HELO|nr:amine oxidase-10 [Coleophoma crateriformis]